MLPRRRSSRPLIGRKSSEATKGVHVGRETARTVQIRIEGSALPGSSCGPSPDAPGGYHNSRVGIRRRDGRAELLGLVPGDAASATWTLDCSAVRSPGGLDFKGPYVQGRLGRRFIYLSWGTLDDAKSFRLFRRAKLWLGVIPPRVLRHALGKGLRVGGLLLTRPTGNTLCSCVRSPAIHWSAVVA